MKKNKKEFISKHHESYDKATEHALRAIYEGVTIKIDSQTFSYNKDKNELSIQDFYGTSIYHPEFNGNFCNPFKELVRQEVNSL